MRSDVKNEIGNRYSRLTVVSYAGYGNKQSQWRCECDCGNFSIKSGSGLRGGVAKSCGCITKERNRDRAFKSGRRITKHGYAQILIPGTGRYRFEHRAIMEDKIGRPLLNNETVHHLNGNKSDNRPENLELWRHNHGPGQRVSDIDRFSHPDPRMWET